MDSGTKLVGHCIRQLSGDSVGEDLMLKSPEWDVTSMTKPIEVGMGGRCLRKTGDRAMTRLTSIRQEACYHGVGGGLRSQRPVTSAAWRERSSDRIGLCRQDCGFQDFEDTEARYGC